MFSSFQSVSTDDYIGLGTSSNNLLRNTIVVPINIIVQKISFSIRKLADSTPYTATLYVNGLATSLSAVISDGSVSYSSSSSGLINVNQEDLITIFVTWTGGALSDGVTISVVADKV